jgi:hypothetical protein
MLPDENRAQFYRDRRASLEPNDGNRWYLLIKELRVENNCGIDEAHRIALSDPVWCRWLEKRINTEPTCRKSALRHIRDHGDAALIEQSGDQLKAR